MPILAAISPPPEATLPPDDLAALLDVRDRLVKMQSVGATILSNATLAIKGVDSVIGVEG